MVYTGTNDKRLQLEIVARYGGLLTNWGWGTAARPCGLHHWTGKWTAYYWAMYIQCSGDFVSCPKYLVRYIQAKTTANQDQRTSRGDKEVTSAQRRVPELELPYARIVCSNTMQTIEQSALKIKLSNCSAGITSGHATYSARKQTTLQAD